MTALPALPVVRVISDRPNHPTLKAFARLVAGEAASGTGRVGVGVRVGFGGGGDGAGAADASGTGMLVDPPAASSPQGTGLRGIARADAVIGAPGDAERPHPGVPQAAPLGDALPRLPAAAERCVGRGRDQSGGDAVDHASPPVAAGPAVPRARDPHAGRRARCAVEFVHPRDPFTGHDAAVLYLLKSREADALRLARRAEAQGVRVVNSAAATEACLDRVAMARVARGAGLPFPVTVAFAGRQGVVEWAGERAGETRRFVLKSRHSRRSNPVPVVGTPRELAAVAAAWADEPLVVQDFADGDGWDHKFWVIGDRVFAGLRLPPEGVAGASERPAAPTAHGASGLASTADPSAAAGSSPPVDHPPAAKRTVELPPDAVPPDWSGLVRRVGDAFGLSVYGVDLLAAPAGPVIVDINAFPGFQGVTGAPEALAELAAEIVAAAESRGGAGQVTDAPLP